ncbi:MAG: hypothetical protein ACKO68_03275 [Bacteroidota bacterium]
MKTLLIQEISFSSASKNVVCRGHLNIGHLSIETKIHVDFRQLNVLLNKLSKHLSSEELYACLEEDTNAEGSFYNLKLDTIEVLPIDLNEINEENNFPLRISA